MFYSHVFVLYKLETKVCVCVWEGGGGFVHKCVTAEYIVQCNTRLVIPFDVHGPNQYRLALISTTGTIAYYEQ